MAVAAPQNFIKLIALHFWTPFYIWDLNNPATVLAALCCRCGKGFFTSKVPAPHAHKVIHRIQAVDQETCPSDRGRVVSGTRKRILPEVITAWVVGGLTSILIGPQGNMFGQIWNDLSDFIS